MDNYSGIDMYYGLSSCNKNKQQNTFQLDIPLMDVVVLVGSLTWSSSYSDMPICLGHLFVALFRAYAKLFLFAFCLLSFQKYKLGGFGTSLSCALLLRSAAFLYIGMYLALGFL